MTKLIEFSGTPDAGKTTLVNSLYTKFSNEGKKVILLGEANGQTLPPQNLRGSLSYNEWVGQNACIGILEALEQNPDLLLVDRGFLDFRFWNYFYQKTGKATSEEVKDLQSKALFSNRKLVPDLFVAVTVSLEEAFRRNPLLKNKAEWVSNHNALFESFYSSYKGSKAYLDTSSLSKDGVVDSALNLIYSNIPELSLSNKKSPEHEER